MLAFHLGTGTGQRPGDPPEHEDPSPIELPPTWVRRLNYGPWLKAMGLSGVAEKLSSGETRLRREVRLPVVRIREQEFALRRQYYPFETLRQICFGIDVKALSAISAAIGGEYEQLLEYRGIEESINPEREFASDSVFPDGTYLGSIENADEYIDRRTFLL